MVTTEFDLNQQTAFKLKGSLFTLTVLQLTSTDFALIQQQLQQTITKTPKFFANAPLIIDLQPINKDDETLNFADLKHLLNSLNLVVVGIRGGNKQQQQAAQDAGLAIFPQSKSENLFVNRVVPKNAAEQSPKAVTAAAVPEAKQDTKPAATVTASKLVTSPVRAGQQIFSEGDLIVTASVSDGAELLAKGNIHVYGTLRGRALAGIDGNQDARIFCKTSKAQLLSIAGIYMLSDDDTSKTKSSGGLMIYLADDRIQISEL